VFVPKYPKNFPLITALLGLVILAFGQASAQYFGQNNVIYRNFNFKILKTKHFNIYYYPREERGVADVGRMAERWYERHSRMLGHELGSQQPLILYASSPQFLETNVVSGLGEGTGGVTEALKRRIVLPFAGPIKETNHVIGHELVHAFQYDLTGERGGSGAMINSPVLRLPLWFIEGMAEFLSLGPHDANTAMYLRDAMISKKKLPRIRDLEKSDYFPYRWGQALLAYIAGKYGDDKIGQMLNAAGTSGDIKSTIRSVLGMSTDSLSRDWQQAIHAEYDSLAKITKAPRDYGKQIISKERGSGELNIGPVISPDGKNLIFYSSKSLFGIDLYLADAETGKIKRRIVETELDPHYSSLEFIYSAGAWSPDGKQIVFSSIIKDQPAISIYDIASDKRTMEKLFKNVDEVYNPSWSPDGRYIAFSALIDGFTDLFIYDVHADSLRRITEDKYAELEPSWSPDGRKIAFVTDRFSTDLKTLDPGEYEIALLDVETGNITRVPLFNEGKHIDPQWTADGTGLYFVSDKNGISDIYRTDLTGNIYRITNLFTGVSGITDISPVISSAREKDRLVFTAFEDAKYNIYLIDSPDVLRGAPVQDQEGFAYLKNMAPPIDTNQSIGASTPPTLIGEGLLVRDTTRSADSTQEESLVPPKEIVWAPTDAAMLPPVPRPEGELLTFLNDPKFGLPSTEDFRYADYHSRLSLDYVGQPYLAAGADPLGLQLGGGAALFWSDMLGNHNLITALQLQTDGGFTDFGGLVAYQNMKHRWNWALESQQVPYTLIQTIGSLDANGNLVEQDYSFRQINREAAGILSYPFSRVLRMEFSGGYQHIGFSQKVRTIVFDQAGNTISDNTANIPFPLGSLDLAMGSAALIYDNAIMGATSPVLGQRFHFEAIPMIGNIKLTNAIIDYRKYFMPIRPFTLAFRGLHFGRYGSGADDERLTPLFIGYQDLVRGYDAGSFSVAEIQADTSLFDRLLGSKIAVANAELRFPLFGALHLGSGYYGFLPIEAGVFYDIGVAWTNQQKASFFSGGTRKPFRSYGAVARLNLLGYLILEADYVKPLDRPLKGAYWQFNITPGF
jgi:Tol biopolymer transport system component